MYIYIYDISSLRVNLASLFNSHASYLGPNLTSNIVGYYKVMKLRRFSRFVGGWPEIEPSSVHSDYY